MEFEFKVGDKVRVYRIADTLISEDADIYLGQTGKVISIDPDCDWPYEVDFGAGQSRYLANELEAAR